MKDSSVAKVSQWLSDRLVLSDWLSRRKTGAGNRVSLEKQSGGFTEHPLLMGEPMMQGVGLQRPSVPETSRLPLVEQAQGAILGAVITDDIWEVGYQRPSVRFQSRVPLYDVTEPDLWDILATEDLVPICTQDGEPIGMA